MGISCADHVTPLHTQTLALSSPTGGGRSVGIVRLRTKATEFSLVSTEDHNEELNDLYSSPNIFRVIKSRRMRWEGHVARMGEKRGVYRVLVGKPEGRNRLGDPDVDGRIILGWIFRKWYVGLWTGSIWLMIGTDGGHL